MPATIGCGFDPGIEGTAVVRGAQWIGKWNMK
jgi:hypothetical protein